jgi:hypothetical protein
MTINVSDLYCIFYFICLKQFYHRNSPVVNGITVLLQYIEKLLVTKLN